MKNLNHRNSSSLFTTTSYKQQKHWNKPWTWRLPRLPLYILVHNVEIEIQKLKKNTAFCGKNPDSGFWYRLMLYHSSFKQTTVRVIWEV